MLSIVEKAFLVKLYYKNSESAIAALLAYRYMKGMRDSKGPITSSALKKMMKKFEATGSLALRQRSERLSTAAAVATTVEQTVQSMSAVAAHGECSAREVSRQTGVPYGSVWKALRITLKRYPYKLQHKQELKPPDFDSRRVSNPDRKVLLHWAEEAVPPYRKTQSIVFTNDIQPLKYNLLPPSSYKTTEEWTAGNYTYLYANFTFVRRISSSLLNVYVPSTLVVFLSWISFWLDVAAVPARITLGVTSLLTLATQVVQARSGLPTISYMTAMDIWLFVCLLTVFGSLLEYAFTYQIYFVNRKNLASGTQASENISSDRQNRKDEVRSRNSSKVQMMSVTRPKRILEPKSANRYFHPNERELDSYCRRLFPLVFGIFAFVYWCYYLWIK
ncbi:glycine receptor subunit alphaZ1 [Caerostris darwini]|uniref:Glycine receptor subunit alphaZ1 n=1 Tax=Caerostris darwini TaxID=1538125 RepID=A0AAV4N3G7_9ARAC|nr:glycine receptor subunit alphaZ1 [Caerostris darwini]